jgi:hypothetical protein
LLNESITDILDVLETPSIQLYPNPSDGLLNVEVKGSCSYSVLGVDGRLCFNGYLTNTTQLDLRHLPYGCYFITVTHAGITEYVKVLLYP